MGYITHSGQSSVKQFILKPDNILNFELDTAAKHMKTSVRNDSQMEAIIEEQTFPSVRIHLRQNYIPRGGSD